MIIAANVRYSILVSYMNGILSYSLIIVYTMKLKNNIINHAILSVEPFVHYKFLFKNTSWLRFSSLKRDLRWQLMYQIVEKILSDGVDIAGIARYSLAILARVGIGSYFSSTILKDLPFCQCIQHCSTMTILFIFVLTS